uniref:SANT domain-containing protein n=2 Tax=Hordeum vulgare subsp. vulgare TaxID=112509 RepID=A0A8I6WT15_HORVV
MLQMNYLEIKNGEEYLMDPIEIKDNEGSPVEMLVEQPHFLEPICPDEVNEDTRVYPRVGDEYQVEVPNLLTEEERMKLRSLPVDGSRMFGFEYPVVVGLTIPVTWTPNTSTLVKGERREFSGHTLCASEDDHNSHITAIIPRTLPQHSVYPECLCSKVEHDDHGEKFSKYAGQDMYCLPKSEVLSCSCAKREVTDYSPLPGMPRYFWSVEEEQIFLLGLYIFGKNLVQVTKFIKSKTMGEVLSYYYGEFFKSDAYKRWSACRKVRSRRCILGLRIFSGSRQQELLSRLLAGVAREVQDPLLEVFKTFNEGTSDFEQFILCLRSTVGAQVLIEAVGIGKGKYDLTGFALDPSRKHAIPSRAEIPIGKACSSLSSGEIIKYLTGDFRLSKAKSNDLFWEAVWPRLLARGWHSQQPKDSLLVGKHALVFLIPGVKKFSRKKLVKGNHYFDSVSDVLRKVASDPRLLEFGVEGGNNGGDSKLAIGWINDVEPDKSTLVDKKSASYIRPSEPGCSPELMKFTVVDTSLVQGEEPCKVRSLRNLPTDAGHGYSSSPHSGDSVSVNSEEHSDSEDSSEPYEDLDTNQRKTDASCASKERKSIPQAADKMDADVMHKISSFPGRFNGHISVDQCVGTMNNVCSSTATVLPVGNQRAHATNSSTEINFQFDPRVNPEPQVFLAPMPKRRRLVSSKNERTGRKATAANKRHYGKQADTPVQPVPKANEASAGTNPFVWNTISSSSTNITFGADSNHTYCGQLHNVPPNVEVVYKEKAQRKHVIDLNIPQMPSDYESTTSYIQPPSDNRALIMDIPMHPSETKEADDCLPDINTSSNAILSEELSFNSRRQSTRSRPLTSRALEALACGFMGKQKGGEGNFPSSSRSSRPVRRPRRSTDVAVPFPSDGVGSGSHFTDQAITINEWRMSNNQYQILHSAPSNNSNEKGTLELFGADNSTDKGTREIVWHSVDGMKTSNELHAQQLQ